MTAKFNYAAHQIAFCPLMKEYAYVPKPPQTPAQRKASERQRHKEAGRTEVRGIYADPADHAAIKAYAAKLARKRGAVPAYWSDARGTHPHLLRGT